MARVDADAGIAFALSQVKVALQAGQLVEFARQITGLGAHFLHANTIRLGRGNPRFHAFAGGRANAVKVETG